MNLLLCCALLFFIETPEPNAASIIEKADALLSLPQGRITGRLKYVTQSGAGFAFDAEIFVKGENYLTVFSSGRRKEEIKILSLLRGADLHVYLSQHYDKHIHKTGSDRYIKVLGTNFYFEDFTGYSLKSNYTAAVAGSENIEGVDCWKLELVHVEPAYGYGTLTLYSVQENFFPVRIEYKDKLGIIIKSLDVITPDMNEDFYIRYQMLDVRSGSASFLTLNKPDVSYVPDVNMFKPYKHGK